MKVNRLVFKNGESHGFTRTQLVVVVGAGAILFGLAFAAVSKAKEMSRRIGCTCNLKQVGLSFRIFATDRGDLFPMGVSTNKGGSMEFVNTGEVFRHFRAMSNELSTPKVLVCPSDKRKTASNFSVLSNANISYFVSLDAQSTFPQALLAGDRNLMTNGVPVGSGLLELTTNLTVGWTAVMHKNTGNLVLGDGSVQQANSPRLQDQVAHSGVLTNRLLIP